MITKNIRPFGNFEIDPDTGLPSLPGEDYFYRVARTSNGYWQVQLRRNRKNWLSKEEESRTFAPETPITEERVLEGAAHALIKWLERDERASNEALLGDYPPKKLES